MRERLGRRPALDGVRAVAIAGVMGLHAISRVVPGGAFGVDVFFVLSAFLITTLIVEELDDHEGRFSYRDFYARRALRLGPALLVFLAVIAPVTAVAIHQGGSIASSTLFSLFYLGDFAAAFGWNLGSAYTHVWSLAIEEQFYIVWAPLLLVLYRRHARRSLLVPALALVVAIELSTAHTIDQNYFLPTGHLVPIALGVATAAMFRHPVVRLSKITRSSTTGIGALVLIAASFVLTKSPGVNEFFVVQVAVGACAMLLILHLCARSDTLTSRFLSWSPVMWVGQRSYGLYLYHRTLAILIPALIPGITLRYAGPLVIALSLVIAAVSFRFVERPISVAGRRRLNPRRNASHQPVAARTLELRGP
jgi:peptidoglycan/LPS O-acetylase OafA/YrhL